MDSDVNKDAHAQQAPWKDKIDGLDYIENTIRWDIHKASLPQRHVLTFTEPCFPGHEGRGGDTF